MPLATFLQTSLVRDANVSTALAFFPRWRGGFWQKICGSTLSTSFVEPFALAGASPLVKRFLGNMSSRGIMSWKLQVPNLLFKNFEQIARSDIEFDQTGTILQRCKAIAIRVAQAPDYLMARTLMTGSLTSSATITADNGVFYNTTIEPGIPMFSTAHGTYAGATQSNIIQGNLPSTVAALATYDAATIVNNMQKDLTLLLDALGGIKDDKGGIVYPDLDPELHMVVVVPPCLKYYANLAFRTPAAQIGGSNGSTGSSGSTTNIMPMFVKDVVCSPLLKGCVDILAQDDTTFVTPVHATDYYVMITNDYVRPFYFQRFRPKEDSEWWPKGVNPQQQAAEAIAAAKSIGMKVTPESADVYAGTIVDNNLSAVGNNSQYDVVANERFFMSGRTRFALVNSIWWTAWKIDPSGTSS